MSVSAYGFHPRPISIQVGNETLEIRSTEAAARLLRSLSQDRLGGPAARLVRQLETARRPEECAHAWVSFSNWAMACGLHSESNSRPHAA